MKKILTLAFALVALASAAIAQEKAKIYFIRSTGYVGSASKFKCFINKKIVCGLNNKRYSIHEVEPGSYEIVAQLVSKEFKKGEEPILLNVESKKTYYVQLVLATKKFKTHLLCQEINEASAKFFLEGMKQDNCF